MKEDGVDKFFADYPDGLLVTLVREPGAWLSSFVRHKPKRGTNSALRQWLNSVDKSVRTYEARPTQVVVLIFEELVRQTEAVMRVLCERMAIPFSDVLLEPTYNSMPVLSDSSHELVTGLDPRVTDRYQTTLSDEQREMVARKATPLYMTIRERFTVTQGA